VRRHPDGKWRHRASAVERFAREQARLADAVWRLLVPGGKLLYATCSVFDAENEMQVKHFLQEHPGALRETISFAPDVPAIGGQLLPSSDGASHNQDGFFYALLRKG
jgi:16S rRNA (cytosine967-C5)-methyltransferase